MSHPSHCSLQGLALALLLSLASSATAETVVTTFDEFTSGALYAGWSGATVESNPEYYAITATGYGSNWKYIPVDATGETTVRLAVTLSTVNTNAGKIGPIVTLVDGDGTTCNYAWYGQRNGSLVLTKPIASPTWVSAAGSVAGLNLATLSHLHVAIDPSDYSGQYTVSWEDLRLTGAPPLAVSAPSYNPVTKEFTLNWVSKPGKYYAVLYAATLEDAFGPLATDIPSEGASTKTTVTMPEGGSGFLRIQEQ
jgi:hypothetical protein